MLIQEIDRLLIRWRVPLVSSLCNDLFIIIEFISRPTRRQILTTKVDPRAVTATKVDPRAVRVQIFIMVEDPEHRYSNESERAN